MELVILLVAVVAAMGWFIWNERQHEKNGSHPLDSATKNAILDVNKDGKVDIKDAVAAVEVVKEEVKTVAKKTATKAKKAVVKAEEVVQKVKKPRSKKS
jgi:lipopolysaccharide biosynthesis regulator YciM